jgi:hypothetical protein
LILFTSGAIDFNSLSLAVPNIFLASVCIIVLSSVPNYKKNALLKRCFNF